MCERTSLTVVLVIIVMSFSAPILCADPLIVQAEGVGKPPERGTPTQKLLMARRAAEVVALRELTKKVRGSVVSSDGKTEWVAGMVRGHQFSRPEKLSDGSIRIVARITLDQLGGNYRTLWIQTQSERAAALAREQSLQAELQRTRMVNAQLQAQLTQFQQGMARQLAAIQAQVAQMLALITQQQAEIERLKQGAAGTPAPTTPPRE